MSTHPQIHLGIDLGAESGRVMAGHWDGKTMRLEELHRFANGGVEIAGTLRWDVLRLWAEIQSGLALARQRFGDAIVSIGVDTWGVDYVLLSKTGELLGLPRTYRDARTRGLLAQTCGRVPRAEIFAQTGAQFLEINTLFQLLAAQRALSSAPGVRCDEQSASGSDYSPVCLPPPTWQHRHRIDLHGALITSDLATLPVVPPRR